MTDNCLFCRIIKKEIPSSIVYEDESYLAFNDISPKAPVHILVIPKKHAANLSEVSDFKLIGDLYAVIKKLAADKGIDQTGFRVVVNQGADSGQAVDHLHFHLLGGRPLHWPPG